jgi:hypothetical protein
MFVTDYNVRDMFNKAVAPITDLEDQFATVRAEGRAAGLEEAATLIDHDHAHGTYANRDHLRRIAATIRALKEKP